MDQPSPVPASRFPDHPTLAARLPQVSLGCWPTPVERAAGLGRALGLSGLYLKRDDLSGERYGSNKVRKLELLLGEAVQRGASGVFTLGFAGSNHALATALYARQLGLACTALLMPQASAPYVRQNLLAGQAAGARLIPCRNSLVLGLRYLQRQRTDYLIPAGGTCPLGVAAYVNAAFELRGQIQAGLLPEPDRIYVPFGSMGTTAGLSLGLQAAGLRTRIEAVRVIEPRWASASGLKHLLRRSLALLRDLDPTFPQLQELGANLNLRGDQLGQGYAMPTAAGLAAEQLMHAHTGLRLNPTYSAKAFAALVADAHAGLLEGRTVLYWNTYNTRDLSSLIQGQDYHHLPEAFHRYFEAASPA